MDKKLSFSPQEQEDLYAAGYGLYEHGKCQEASEVFTQLVLCDPFMERSWRGLAAACQVDQRLEEALHAWAMVCLLKDEDPMPHYHAAECLTSLGKREDALKALKQAEARLGTTPSPFAEKIALMKGALS